MAKNWKFARRRISSTFSDPGFFPNITSSTTTTTATAITAASSTRRRPPTPAFTPVRISTRGGRPARSRPRPETPRCSDAGCVKRTGGACPGCGKKIRTFSASTTWLLSRIRVFAFFARKRPTSGICTSSKCCCKQDGKVVLTCRWVGNLNWIP